MQNAERHKLKKQGHSTNRFNDAEYERWSKGTTGDRPLKAQSRIQSFLGTSENMQAGREDISVSLTKIGEK
jgi:hypothetical protein